MTENYDNNHTVQCVLTCLDNTDTDSLANYAEIEPNFCLKKNLICKKGFLSCCCFHGKKGLSSRDLSHLFFQISWEVERNFIIEGKNKLHLERPISEIGLGGRGEGYT